MEFYFSGNDLLFSIANIYERSDKKPTNLMSTDWNVKTMLVRRVQDLLIRFH